MKSLADCIRLHGDESSTFSYEYQLFVWKRAERLTGKRFSISEIADHLERLENLFSYWAACDHGGLFDGDGHPSSWDPDPEWGRNFETTVQRLFHRRQDAWTKKMLGIDLAWPEWFAVLAFGYVAQFRHREEQAFHEKRKDLAGSELVAGAESLAVAVEAICFAEQLSDDQSAYKVSEREVRSELARQSARARYAPLDALKSEFVNYYKAGVFKSKGAAAEMFMATQPRERQKLIAVHNIRRTLVPLLRDV